MSNATCPRRRHVVSALHAAQTGLAVVTWSTSAPRRLLNNAVQRRRHGLARSIRTDVRYVEDTSSVGRAAATNWSYAPSRTAAAISCSVTGVFRAKPQFFSFSGFERRPIDLFLLSSGRKSLSFWHRSLPLDAVHCRVFFPPLPVRGPRTTARALHQHKHFLFSSGANLVLSFHHAGPACR